MRTQILTEIQDMKGGNKMKMTKWTILKTNGMIFKEKKRKQMRILKEN